jgi:uncharacterized protein YkwD
MAVRRNGQGHCTGSGQARNTMRMGLGRVPFAAVLAGVVLLVTPSLAAAQGTGCHFTRSAATAAPEPNMRSALRCLVNVERARHGLPMLRSSQELNVAADGHGADMVARHYFAHVSPEGASVADRVRASGYLGGSDDWALGEDIGWGTGSESTPESIFQAFMNSPPHRRVILDRDFRQIGVGVAAGVPVSVPGDGATFVLDFGDVS